MKNSSLEKDSPHCGWQASEVRKRDDKPQLNHDAIKAELTPVKAATSTYKLTMYNVVGTRHSHRSEVPRTPTLTSLMPMFLEGFKQIDYCPYTCSCLAMVSTNFGCLQGFFLSKNESSEYAKKSNEKGR